MVVNRKMTWRTRKTGTPSQVGTRFPVSTGEKDYRGSGSLQVFKVSSQNSPSGGDDMVNQVLSLPVGATWCPVKGKRLPRIIITQDYVRLRVREPGLFEGEWDKKDVGRNTKRIVGKRKITGEWDTQAWLFKREDLMREKETRDLFLEILGKKVDRPLIMRVEE